LHGGSATGRRRKHVLRARADLMIVVVTGSLRNSRSEPRSGS